MTDQVLILLSSWLDRIPFTLMFGISTSIELFEGRLPRSSVALLRGKYFELHESSNCVDRIYDRLQAEPDGELWLGRNITGVLFERSSDYFNTPEAFSRTVKVCRALVASVLSLTYCSTHICPISLRTHWQYCFQRTLLPNCLTANYARQSGICRLSEGEYSCYSDQGTI